MDSIGDDSSEGGQPSDLLPSPESIRPAVWAWPLILLSSLAIALAPYLHPKAAEAIAEEGYATRLVTLQMQARIVIGVAAINPKQAADELKKLNELVKDDGAAAALAALHVFVRLKDPAIDEANSILDRRIETGEANGEFLEQVRRGLSDGVNESEREDFRIHLGGFADFFPDDGDPSSWPKGEELRTKSVLMVAGLGLASLGALALALAGLVLLIVAGVRIRNGSFRVAGGEPVNRSRPGAALLEAFAVFLFIFTCSQMGSWSLHWSLQIGLAIAGIVFGLAWPVWVRRIPWRETRRALGLHRGRGLGREIGAGFTGYLIILPIAAAGFLVMALLMYLAEKFGYSVEPATHPIIGTLEGDWPLLLFIFFFAAILAPVVEEVFFRGAFFGAVRSRWSFVMSGLFTGLIFAAIHPQGIFAIPPLMGIGFGLACIREWRDSLIAPMVTHAINNGVLIGGAVLLLG